MPLVRDRCICLRKVEYSETSQILTLFGREHGLFRTIAKGAHRRTKAGSSKFDGGLDVLDIGDAVVILDPARDLSPLTEWSLRDGHLDLRRNLRGMYLGLYAAELISVLLEEHDPHPELFDRLQTVIPELASIRNEESFLAFELDLLQQTGHAPQLCVCAQCAGSFNERDSTYFSPSRGGAICANCQSVTHDRMPLDTRLLRLAQQVLRLPRANGSPLRLPRLSRHQTDPLNRLLVEHVQHTAGRPLRMATYITG